MRLLPLLPLLLLAASCSSKSADNPVSPPVNDAHGTAVGPDHLFAHASQLVWSAVTDEVIGFSSPTPAAGTGLIAVRVGDGSTRVLDPATPLQLALSPDGAAVYYVVDLPPADGDSVVLRRRPISGGAPEPLGAAADGTPITFVLSLDGDWLAWARAGANPLDPGPLVLHHLSTGDTLEVGVGSPEAIAPDGSQVIYRSGSALRLWVRATRSESDVVLGIPAGTGPPAWRWDANGLRALLVDVNRQVKLFNYPLGTITTVYTSPLDLDGSPAIWSPDGLAGAVWASKPAASGTYTSHVLEVFDIGAKVGVPVASGVEEHGAATFSSDDSRIAQLFGERLYVANAATTGIPVPAR